MNFVKFESHKGDSYSCVVGSTTIGYLHRENDGFYYFFPNHIPGMLWPSIWLKALGHKLSDLNEAEVQRQLGEDGPPFTD
jgi:hypothetical protein